MSRIYDCLVIGGGPAGLMAAGKAAEKSASVAILEKNYGLGKKLLTTGGGRCNFTNATFDARELAKRYGEAEKALLSPFTKFGPQLILDFFDKLGVDHKVEDLGRCFPKSNSASSILDALELYATSAKVEIFTNQEVRSISSENYWQVHTRNKTYQAKKLIFATGGLSHPETGSTGDGFRFLKDLGIPIRIPEPSLVPIRIVEQFTTRLSGLAFQDLGLCIRGDKEIHYQGRGKLLFTHFGLSGPLILNQATTMSTLKNSGKKVTLELDFFPDLSMAESDEDLRVFIESHGKKQIKNTLPFKLPSKLSELILELARINPEKQNSLITKEERKTLLKYLKEFPVEFKKLMDSSRSIVSSGGISIDEIDFRTMEVKKLPNLAVVGDLLDINRPSGGYSLQLCWSTALVAGLWAQI